MNLQALLSALALSAVVSARSENGKLDIPVARGGVVGKRSHSVTPTLTPTTPLPSSSSLPNPTFQAFAEEHPLARYGPSDYWLELLKDDDDQCMVRVNTTQCVGVSQSLGKWDKTSGNCFNETAARVNATLCDGHVNITMYFDTAPWYDTKYPAGTVYYRGHSEHAGSWNLFPLGVKPGCRTWYAGNDEMENRWLLYAEEGCYPDAPKILDRPGAGGNEIRYWSPSNPSGSHSSRLPTKTATPRLSSSVAAQLETFAATHPLAQYGPSNEWVELFKDANDDCKVRLNMSWCHSVTETLGKWNKDTNQCDSPTHNKTTTTTTCGGNAVLTMFWRDATVDVTTFGTDILPAGSVLVWYQHEWEMGEMVLPVGLKPGCRSWWGGYLNAAAQKDPLAYTEPWCGVDIDNMALITKGEVWYWTPASASTSAVPTASRSARSVRKSSFLRA
ncbi:uncharacterized protein N7459_004579 [Penicillium hispanicum]|uniref:uncharacterized protein n=1 Tax=Penicillium hispanicum TaxID=1080232 RepID=UPI00254244B7|nr:uncharacterized protein N7459_004579 [Penicillium hispanicum]KAJ5584779.1 hypothetical protein N7459_004579 [Penicillium hispanicum]